MSIDWFTIIAQVVNFLVLLWLMKRFLYKPILNVIDEREKRIALELANANTVQTEATIQKEEYSKKNAELNSQSAAFLKNAQEEARSTRQRLLDEAREEAEEFSLKQREALAKDKEATGQAISRRTQDQVISIARKVLTDLAGTSLEENMLVVFNKRLGALSETEKETLRSALATGPGTITVLSAFDISHEMRTTIEAQIKDLYGTSAQPVFKKSAGLISGIELNVNGQKVAWSIDDYISSIEEGSRGRLE